MQNNIGTNADVATTQWQNNPLTGKRDNKIISMKYNK